MFKNILYIFFVFTLIACKKDDNQDKPIDGAADFISAVDISALPEIELTNPTYYNLAGAEEEFLSILKNNGVNTIRLKLWVDPQNEHAGFQEVKTFSQRLKNLGFKVWLTLHYSDTWADPGQQLTPNQWKGIAFSSLVDSVNKYTERVMEQMKPDYIQIGNEINSGFLHPQGNLSTNSQQFKTLMSSAIQAVRKVSSKTKIIIHFAGLTNSSWFYNQVTDLDYDIIGLSYYPIWHGKDLANLKNTLQSLSQTHQKDILIAETAYPFTLDWNDWTNNIVGLNDQLILPKYPATPQGQKEFLADIKKIVLDEVEKGIGFCYWGAELIAWKGNQANDASPWENQALFDFSNRALPVIEVFNTD
jgi:arabinogalactan endo-1,4-beta-galactosidase